MALKSVLVLASTLLVVQSKSFQNELVDVSKIQSITTFFSKRKVIHLDLATAGKRAVRPPAVARFGGSEAIWRKSFM